MDWIELGLMWGLGLWWVGWDWIGLDFNMYFFWGGGRGVVVIDVLQDHKVRSLTF